MLTNPGTNDNCFLISLLDFLNSLPLIYCYFLKISAFDFFCYISSTSMDILQINLDVVYALSSNCVILKKKKREMFC